MRKRRRPTLTLLQANAANRLTIDDNARVEPDEFAYIPNMTDGDNGNGYLDIGDDPARAARCVSG
jgi:hypothetical protein